MSEYSTETNTSTRRQFLRLSALTFGTGIAVSAASAISGCTTPTATSIETESDTSSYSNSADKQPLPLGCPAEGSRFDIDKNINIDTIDSWLGRKDVAYRDMRMIHDPADYKAIGGDSNLSVLLEGFKVVPFPYIATLPPLPVEGAYDAERLFDIEWSAEEEVLTVVARYKESMQILEELFPQNKAIFLMCGGGGYASQMRKLLINLGWNPEMIYNTGAAWDYTGKHAITIIDYDTYGNPSFYLWRVDQAPIEFEYLTPTT